MTTITRDGLSSGEATQLEAVLAGLTKLDVISDAIPTSAYTQTFSTAGRTVAALTAVAVVTTTPTTSAYGFTLAQATAIITAVNALITDITEIKKNLNAVIDDLQATGITA